MELRVRRAFFVPLKAGAPTKKNTPGLRLEPPVRRPRMGLMAVSTATETPVLLRTKRQLLCTQHQLLLSQHYEDLLHEVVVNDVLVLVGYRAHA